MYFRYFWIIYPWERAWPFIWTNLNPNHPRILCVKCGWSWLSGSGEEYFLITSKYFRYFRNHLFLERTWSFIWTNLNSHHPRKLCARFGWNWHSGSGDNENVKRWQTDGQTTDDRRSEKLSWAFSSDKLKGKHIPIPNEDIKRFLLISNLHSQESWISQWYAMFRQKFLSAVLTCNLTCFHFSMHGCFWFGM